jgi:hypothetical protein
MDITFLFFYDTLDLVLPATGKKVTDLGTETRVANAVHYITDLTISGATYRHQF